MKIGGKEIKTTKLFKLKMVKYLCASSPVVKDIYFFNWRFQNRSKNY